MSDALTGATGVAGVRGSSGATGVSGQRGNTGQTGRPGATGHTGPTGPRGRSGGTGPHRTISRLSSVVDCTLFLPLYLYLSKREAFEKCWAHSLLRAVLHCHSPGVATAAIVARHLRIDVHDDDDDNDNA